MPFFLLSFVLAFSAQAALTDNTFEHDLDVSEAHCRAPLASPEAMEAFLQKLSQEEPRLSTGVGGLGLKNENQALVNAYRALTSYKDYQFHPVQDIDYWKLFKDGACGKALCAAEKVFGEDRGRLYLYTLARYGINLSHLGFDRLKAPSPDKEQEFQAYFHVAEWEWSELPAHLRAISMLPDSLLPLGNTRMTYAGINNPLKPTIYSNGVIQFYAKSLELSESQKEQTTYHEIGHVVALVHGGLDDSKEWLAASGWEESNGSFANEKKEKPASVYASINPAEDFAETFTYYRYYPALLKARSPSRYEYMKKAVYSGEEFLSDSDCGGAR
jgi:hypothetical protein